MAFRKKPKAKYKSSFNGKLWAAAKKSIPEDFDNAMEFIAVRNASVAAYLRYGRPIREDERQVISTVLLALVHFYVKFR